MKIPTLIYAAAACLVFVLNTAGQTLGVGDSPVIKTTFDPDAAEWQIAWPGRINQYDLVYNSPPIDALQGIPLGNGEIGVLVWCESSKIITDQRGKI